ncbi:hypothetical protein KPL40_17560 [Clostridium gasigenes]|nr:hypothetical protein [Clostridium gasigenes]
MSGKLFNNKEIEILSSNKYVKKVSEKAITYTEDFRNIFIIESDKGKFSKLIFDQCGSDINIIGIERIKSASKRRVPFIVTSPPIALRLLFFFHCYRDHDTVRL